MRINDRLNGRYVLRKELGMGGMGCTYLAEDEEEGAQVVVKTVHDQLLNASGEAGSSLVLRRFKREVKMLRQVVNPHVPKVYDVGSTSGDERPYFVMPFINGTSLDEHLRKNPRLRVEEVAALGISVADALAASHEGGVLHRDVKPSNIMITNSGWVYLIDFGIALPMVGDPTRYTKNLVGSPGYVAPERLAGRNSLSRDHSPSDLYSLGCVLYLMLAGRAPFLESEGGGKSIDSQHLEDVPRSIRELGVRIPSELDELVLALLEKRPEGRPGCAEVVGRMRDYAPRVGAAELNPRSVPDLTLPFREPDRVRPAESRPRERTRDSGFQRGRAAGYRTPAEIKEKLEDIRRRRNVDDRGSAEDRLASLRAEAVQTYGKNNVVVAMIEEAMGEF